MHKLSDLPFSAIITIGLQREYTDELIPETDIISHLQKLQEQLIETKKIYLSANCYPSKIVLSGQVEPHLNLSFINYPKFPLQEQVFKDAVEWLAKELMSSFQQNRIVILFHNSVVMFENNPGIDPRITSS